MAKIKSFKRPLAIILSVALCVTTCVISGLFASATEPKPINVVFSDNFDDPVLNSKWEFMNEGQTTDDGNAYTSEIDNGQLKVNTHKKDRSYLAGLMYLPGEERVDQRVAVETVDLQKYDTVSVWARLNKKDANNWKSMTGYYARYCTANGMIQLFKINTATSNVNLVNCGYRGYTSGENYRLELVVTGTDRVVITVVMYKLTDSGDLVVAKNTYVDTDNPFNSGTAGIGVAGNASATNDYAYLDNFTYTSTDDYNAENPIYLSHLRTGNTKTFGQVVMLEQGVEYVLASYGTVDTADSGGYKNEPLWVEYQTGTVATSSSNYQRVIIDRVDLKKSCDLTEAQCIQNNIEYSEYNVTYVTFTGGEGNYAGGDGATPLVDTNIGDRVRHIVGIRMNQSTNMIGNYSYFTLYRKDDPYKTNLLVNPDFKMGLYGWFDAMAYFGYTMGEETDEITSKNGYMELLSDKNNYEYYEAFKNPQYSGVEGDANRDNKLDICDLVYASFSDSDYYYVADYNKSGKLDDDLKEITYKLLITIVESEPEIIGLDNESIDDGNFK